MKEQQFTYEPDWWDWVATFLRDNWPEIAQGTLSLLFVLVPLLCTAEIAGLITTPLITPQVYVIAIVAILILGALQVWLLIATHRRTERMSDMRLENMRLKQTLEGIKEVKPLQVKPLIFAYLKRLGEQDLQFGGRLGEAERLTLYLHDEERRVFIPLSRFSNSAEFCKITRREYPDDQGCIALAWQKEYHFKYDYPNPISQPAQYLQRCIKDNVPDDVLRKIRMKSVLYCGQVIWSRDRRKQIGVLMLEATYDRYNEGQTAPFMKKEAQGYLGELIAALE